MSASATPDVPLKQCRKCGAFKPLTAEYFGRNRNRKDGFANYCKACSRAYDRWRHTAGRDEFQAQLAAERQTARDLLDAGLRVCSQCGETLPLDAFYKGGRNPGNRKSMCKACYARSMGWEHRPRATFPPAPEGFQYCRACAELKPVSDFYRVWSNRDALMTICKVCSTAKCERERVARGVRLREKWPEGYRRCPHCKRLLPATLAHFGRAPQARGGVGGWCRDCMRAWKVEHPERARQLGVVSYHRRRARVRRLPSGFTAADWDRCLDYWDHRCAICGRPAGLWHTLAADHWIPVTSDGGTVATNIVPLCHGEDGCNNHKGKRDPVEYLTGEFGPRKAKRILARIDAYFAWVRAQGH